MFYFQYLKLCFEIGNTSYKEKIYKIIVNPEFIFIFPPGKDPHIYNDSQFKRLIMEFFEFMSQTKKLVAESLKLFPIMDIVFTFFFRAMLIYGHQTDHFDNYLEK